MAGRSGRCQWHRRGVLFCLPQWQLHCHIGAPAFVDSSVSPGPPILPLLPFDFHTNSGPFTTFTVTTPRRQRRPAPSRRPPTGTYWARPANKSTCARATSTFASASESGWPRRLRFRSRLSYNSGNCVRTRRHLAARSRCRLWLRLEAASGSILRYTPTSSPSITTSSPMPAARNIAWTRTPTACGPRRKASTPPTTPAAAPLFPRRHVLGFRRQFGGHRGRCRHPLPDAVPGHQRQPDPAPLRRGLGTSVTGSSARIVQVEDVRAGGALPARTISPTTPIPSRT